MEKKRIVVFDYLKGITIFLTVWCHCLQYITSQSFNNTLYSIVYSFHMPLFIIISGYLFVKKVDAPIIQITTKQFKRLIIPNIMWGLLAMCITSILTFTPPNLLIIPKSAAFCWFLSTLFIGSICYVFAVKIGIRNIITTTLLLSFISLLLPSNEFLKFLIPFFGVGLILAQTNVINCNFKWSHIIISGVIIIVMYELLWYRSFYIYCTENPSFTDFSHPKWTAYFARILFGSCISIWLILLVRKMESIIGKAKNLLTILSKNSLGIYVIHYSFFSISQNYFKGLQLNIQGISSCILTFFIVIIMIATINRTIYYLRLNNIIRMLFLGESKREHQ